MNHKRDNFCNFGVKRNANSLCLNAEVCLKFVKLSKQGARDEVVVVP